MSQQGAITALAPAEIVVAEETSIHLISWTSTIIKRTCRATLQAESYSLTTGVERGSRLRAAIVDARGLLTPKRWEETAQANMFHVWLTDCDSLYEHLVSPKMSSIQNKRLAIDLQALRQDIWSDDNDRMESLDITKGDDPRWIDTSTMIADPLTKAMKPDRLLNTMETGVLDLRPTPESLAIKEKSRKARQAKKELEKGVADEISSIYDGD